MSTVTPIKQSSADELPSRKTLQKRIDEQRDTIFQAQAIIRVVGDLLHALNDGEEPPDRTNLAVSLSMSVAEEMLDTIAAGLGGVLRPDT